MFYIQCKTEAVRRLSPQTIRSKTKCKCSAIYKFGNIIIGIKPQDKNHTVGLHHQKDTNKENKMNEPKGKRYVIYTSFGVLLDLSRNGCLYSNYTKNWQSATTFGKKAAQKFIDQVKEKGDPAAPKEMKMVEVIGGADLPGYATEKLERASRELLNRMGLVTLTD